MLDGKDITLIRMNKRKLQYWSRWLVLASGRGIFLIFVGTLVFCDSNVLFHISGGFVIYVGLLMIHLGRKVIDILSRVSRIIAGEEDLKKKFEQVDIEGRGFITIGDFNAFMCLYGEPNLSFNELSATFTTIDEDDHGKIRLDDLIAWWQKSQFHGGEIFAKL